MKTLILEDDFTGRLLLQRLLQQWGQTHIAVNGWEAVEAVRAAWESGKPYDLICLDIMMPEMDGQTALKEIRKCEEERGIFSSQGVKIVMTTALGNMENVKDAFHNLCDGYLVKPIDKEKLLKNLQTLELVS